MHFYQLIVVVISSIMLLQGMFRLANNFSRQSILKIGTRIVVWGSMIIIAIFPNITTNVAKFIGMEGNINSIILLGFLLIFVIIFRLMSIIERIEKDISVLTRKEALKDKNNGGIK